MVPNNNFFSIIIITNNKFIYEFIIKSLINWNVLWIYMKKIKKEERSVRIINNLREN